MISQEMLKLGRHRSVIREIFEYGNQRRGQIGAQNVFDFSLGNPSVPAPPIVTDTLQQLLADEPAQTLHAYTSAAGDPSVRNAIAAYIRNTYGFEAEARHIYMTAGAAASLTITLTALVTPDDEVIALAPYFPEYRVFVQKTGAKFVTVDCTPDTFQIDAQRLEAAINSHTKAVIINSPNNPTGVVLDQKSIDTLVTVLQTKSAQFGHPIYLVCDEPYRELVYDDIQVPYLPLHYRDTVVCYSYSKSLSLPGARIGYILVSSRMEDADMVFDAVCGAGRALGFVCAPSLFQRLVAKCQGCTADISVYDRNRRLLYDALTEYGFTAVYPDGAFYLFVKSPIPDANAFCMKAREYELLLVPGDDFGCPGYVRIAYCVTTEQIQRSLPAFRQLGQYYAGV